MPSFLQQIIALLTSETGSLAYHLVVAFSMVGALLFAIIYWRLGDPRRGGRMVLGLSLLLILQLGSFLFAGFLWQGLVDGVWFLPLMDRAISLLSLLVIVWLWAFPERSQYADSATLLVGLLLLTTIFFGAVWLNNQSVNGVLTGSGLDTVANIVGLAILILGILLLFRRRTPGWVAGVCMLSLLLIGYGLHYLIAEPGTDYSGAIRLSMLAAYPLLLLLPMRFIEGFYPAGQADGQEAKSDAPIPATIVDSREEADLVESLLASMADAPADQACIAAAKAISEHLKADICLLFSAPDNGAAIKMICGYDHIRQLPLPEFTLDKGQAPVVNSSLRQGRAVRLPGRSASPDMTGIAHAIGLNHTGHLIIVPVLSSDGKPLYGVVLISPYTDRSWSVEDQSKLSRVAKPLVYFLQLQHHIASLQTELAEARQVARKAQSRVEQVEQEYQRMISQGTIPGEEVRNPHHLSEPGQEERLREQLRMALEELAHLRSIQASSGQGIASQSVPTATTANSE